MSLRQALKEAVFDRDADRIEQLWAENESVAAALIDDMVALADKAGSACMTVLLLRLTDDTDTRNWESLFIDYVSELSQDISAASWFAGVEFFLWSVVSGAGLRDETPFQEFSHPPNSTVKDLAFLRDRANGWPVWRDSASRPHVLPLPQWERLYGTYGATSKS